MDVSGLPHPYQRRIRENRRALTRFFFEKSRRRFPGFHPPFLLAMLYQGESSFADDELEVCSTLKLLSEAGPETSARRRRCASATGGR